jgi:proline dehydrogenase
MTSNTVTFYVMCVCATEDEKQVSKEAMAQQAAEAHSAEIRSLGDDIGKAVSQSVTSLVTDPLYSMLY